MSLLAIAIGLYPITYFVVDREFGLLSSKTPGLLADIIWNIAFYIHIVLGGLALLIGWMQFNAKLRNNNLRRHRLIGKIYIVSVLLSSVAGFYIAFFATGGIISASGFICLALVWFYTTLTAYTSIRKGQHRRHQEMMIYSYAACFAAVTLRIWLPLLTSAFGEFVPAYKIVAWLAWVPNLVIAYFIVKRSLPQKIQPLPIQPWDKQVSGLY
jgi:uncharacterized membrane protein